MDTTTCQARRQALATDMAQRAANGAILLLGNDEASRNYPDNVYPFRQDSSFLYFTGLRQAGQALLLLPDGEECLFGTPEHPDDVVWSGPHPTLHDHAVAAGIAGAEDLAKLGERLAALEQKGLTVHYLPPYRGDRRQQLASLLGLAPDGVADGVSWDLVKAVIARREIKSEAEIAAIENALSVTAEMYRTAMQMTRPGLVEAEIAGAMQAVALQRDRQQSFPPIVSIHGEVLHNTSYANTLTDGRLLVIDSGAESPEHYASDITRTLPVNGKYSTQQREIYEVVLSAQTTAIEMASPRVTNREMHLAAARATTVGLQALGLMRGDVDESVAAGAHALFFPHGLGHALGLDVHDMEDLGDLVGYEEGDKRSEQFGLGYLRFAKQLQPGYVLTVEPGCYFIPALIDRWREQQLHAEFINFDSLASYCEFGGIRIEDDILITEDGCRVLGTPIPKEPAAVEVAMAE
ncbi:MAG: aminopeptidase P family protein [bacterium]